jgi:hypothetical protein
MDDKNIVGTKFLHACSEIESGQTLCFKTLTVYESSSWIGYFTRRWHAENRKVLLEKMRPMFKNLILDHIGHSLDRIESCTLFINALCGLKKLFGTYTDDPKFCEELSAMLLNMDQLLLDHYDNRIICRCEIFKIDHQKRSEPIPIKNNSQEIEKSNLEDQDIQIVKSPEHIVSQKIDKVEPYEINLKSKKCTPETLGFPDYIQKLYAYPEISKKKPLYSFLGV